MMISRLSLIMLAVASIAFTSCKKDKGNPSNPVEQTKKLSRIEENGQTTATFTYNADGAIKTLVTDLGMFGSTTFTFSYNEQKKISEINSNDGTKIKYVYQGGTLVWTETYEDGAKIGENNLVYENGKVKSNTYLSAFPKEDGSVSYIPTFRTVYLYNANGSVQKISSYVMGANNQLELDHEYAYDQYDNKKNPLFVMSDFSQTFLYQPISPNNPLTEKWVNANGGIDETTVNEYTYDAAGYPVTIKSTTTTNGTPTVRTSKLYY